MGERASLCFGAGISMVYVSSRPQFVPTSRPYVEELPETESRRRKKGGRGREGKFRVMGSNWFFSYNNYLQDDREQ